MAVEKHHRCKCFATLELPKDACERRPQGCRQHGIEALAHTRVARHVGLDQGIGHFMEVVLSLRTQLTQGPTKFKQRGAQSLSEFAKRPTIADVSSLGHAIEI